MWWLAAKRRYYYRRTNSAAMRAFLEAPLAVASDYFADSEFLVVDLETTSLHAETGEIASIGWVPVKQSAIQLIEAEHYFCSIQSGVGQSAVIHHIHDSELDNALPVAVIMQRLLEVAAGKVLVFHNACLDMAFLNAAAKKLYLTPLLAPVTDTLLLERRTLLRQGAVIAPEALRLHGCRQRYGLPDYPAHDALTDALATAELLLAWVEHTSGGQKKRLRDCLS